MMTEAQSPAILSGPTLSRSSANADDAAEPDIGLVTASGSISDGIPTALHTPDRYLTIRSAAPLAENIDSATMRAVIVGIIDTVVFIPSRAPRTNHSNASARRNITAPTASITAGIISDEINSVMTLP